MNVEFVTRILDEFAFGDIPLFAVNYDPSTERDIVFIGSVGAVGIDCGGAGTGCTGHIDVFKGGIRAVEHRHCPENKST